MNPIVLVPEYQAITECGRCGHLARGCKKQSPADWEGVGRIQKLHGSACRQGCWNFRQVVHLDVKGKVVFYLTMKPPLAQFFAVQHHINWEGMTCRQFCSQVMPSFRQSIATEWRHLLVLGRCTLPEHVLRPMSRKDVQYQYQNPIPPVISWSLGWIKLSKQGLNGVDRSLVTKLLWSVSLRSWAVKNLRRERVKWKRWNGNCFSSVMKSHKWRTAGHFQMKPLATR